MKKPLSVLLTNHFLSARTGSELYVHDVALGLVARGHRPIVYSPTIGPLAAELAARTVAVVDDLTRLSQPPDVIHAQHSLESLVALLQFPGVPAIYVCHDWIWHHDTPPQLARIGRFVAVDYTVRDRLLLREAIPESRVEVIFNGVDLQRFQPRGPLPPQPRRAVVFSTYLLPPQVEIIRSFCQTQGIELDAIGRHLGGECERPEDVLGQYDLVFAKGRCAWEALATGCAVIVCDAAGLGPLVTAAELERLQRANFGRRLLQQPLEPAHIARQLARYDAIDAGCITPQIRATAGVEQMVDRLLGLYEQVIAAQHPAAAHDHAADMQAAAAFLSAWTNAAQQQAPRHVPPPSPPAESPRPQFAVADLAQLRGLLREEMSRKPVRGLRKLLRSIRKRLPGDFFRRAA